MTVKRKGKIPRTNQTPKERALVIKRMRKLTSERMKNSRRHELRNEVSRYLPNARPVDEQVVSLAFDLESMIGVGKLGDKCTVKEFNDYIERIVAWAAQELGVTVPPN